MRLFPVELLSAPGEYFVFGYLRHYSGFDWILRCPLANLNQVNLKRKSIKYRQIIPLTLLLAVRLNVSSNL